MKKLTKEDCLEIVELVKKEYIKHGVPPSVKKLMDLTGTATLTVERRLILAQKYGLLKQAPNGQYVPVPEFGREALWSQ